jgi:hypothetical protein
MSEPIFNYDEMSDTLYVSFAPGEKATGIELNDHMLLRITGLAELSDELREIVLDILQRPPVSDILFLSTYTPSIVEAIPITSLQPAASPLHVT